MLTRLAGVVPRARVAISAMSISIGSTCLQAPVFNQGRPLLTSVAEPGPALATSPSLPMDSLALSHFFVPADANLAGNVHGGTILKLVEKAGWVASSRYCADAFTSAPAMVTARLDNMSFLAPIHIGELGKLDAKVTYTSPHSMRVNVDVYAENLKTGETRLANSASVWYVAMEKMSSRRPSLGIGLGDAVPRWRVATIPQMPPNADNPLWAEGHALYEARQAADGESKTPLETAGSSWSPLPVCPEHAAESHAVARGTTQLVQLMGVSSGVTAARDSPVAGGFVAKLMDECAGICAFRHCGTNVVTASLDAVDFLVPIYKGNLVTITARPVFTSSKSMEIEVLVEAEDMMRGRIPAIHAMFTFVSLDREGKALPMPALVLKTDDERAQFEAGKARYEARKAARVAAQKAAAGGQA